mmetsp:Transcript_12578/g.39620  ORF Transcript_12578/g.39620 Transcript_12578/m.39620 type:complete len:181 (-) Transcript_12578:136-678(-)
MAALVVLAALSSHVGCRPRGPTPLTRRSFSSVAGSSLAGSALALAFAGPSLAAMKAYSAADAADAVRRMRLSRMALEDVRTAVAAGRFADALALVQAAPISGFENDCTVLVQSSAIDAEDKKSIGTIRRYGIGADVLIMLGGLANAASDEDSAGALSFTTKAAAALDEILQITKAYQALR